MRKGIFLLIGQFLLINCSHFERSLQSGYVQDTAKYQNPASNGLLPFSPLRIEKSLQKLGMTSDDLSTKEGITKIQMAVEIEDLEKNLIDDRERTQYQKSIPWLKNDEEKLDFLKQKGFYARQNWLRQKGIEKRPNEAQPALDDIVAAQDIALGMSSNLVQRAWGSPEFIDRSGNSIYGNERWRYQKYIPTTDGYRLQKRYVYFEGGKVIGWEQTEK